ncbi:MAG: cytochrome c oxidase assembly protein [Solirubrobacteraceae bacterium MAG38_C4-C5]|nr:cytochrome c oxidase assembly protein [Candidatus Siliceabacter maunaloa]
MVQHILLGDLGALGLVLGLTGPLLAPVLRPRMARVVRPLAHPALALPLWMVNLYGWHLSALYQASLEHPVVHALMHAGFVGLGIAMWMPLFGPLPTPRWFTDWVMLLYVFVVRLAGALLANFFIWTQSAVYPDYAEGQRLWAIEPLADQGLAGGILMIEGSVVTLGALLWLFLRAAQRQEDTQQLLDFAADHDIELSPERAARAVHAGRADALRARLADPERQ